MCCTVRNVQEKSYAWFMEEKGTDNRAQVMVYRKEMELSCKEPDNPLRRGLCYCNLLAGEYSAYLLMEHGQFQKTGRRERKTVF